MIRMVKVKIRTGRGTGTIEVDVEDLKFSGEEFKKIQAENRAPEVNYLQKFKLEIELQK